MMKAFAQPGFRRLFGGLTASMFGDSIMLLVLSIWVKTLTGSNGQAGLTFLFMVVPSLIGPFAGVLIDKVRRKPLLVWANLASAVAVLPLLLVRDASDVWIIWAVAFCYGISFVVIPAALNGLLKEILPDELLIEANGSLQTIKESFRLFGPLIGAGLFALTGGWIVAVIDAATFLVAAAAIATLKVREEQPEPEEGHMWSQFTAGVAHLNRDRIMKHLLIGLAICLTVIGFLESGIFAVLDHFHKTASFASVLVTIQGIGSVIGGLTSSRMVKKYGEPATIAASLGLVSVSIALLAVSPWLWWAILAMIPMGVGLPWLMVAYMTVLQVRTPQRLMGRVSTAAEVMLSGPQSMSLALGALLVVALPWRELFLVTSAVVLVSMVYLLVALREEMRAHHVPAVAGAEDEPSISGGAVAAAIEGQPVLGVPFSEIQHAADDDVVVTGFVDGEDRAVDVSHDAVQKR